MYNIMQILHNIIHYMQTRYSDGSYPVWYASESIKTTIYETVHNTLRFVLAEQGNEEHKLIKRKRAVYDVLCDAHLVDLRDKQTQYPGIMADDYEFTQQVGLEIQRHKLAGVISPSVRWQRGANFNIFTQSVLHSPQRLSYLRYAVDPKLRAVKVTGLEHNMLIEY